MKSENENDKKKHNLKSRNNLLKITFFFVSKISFSFTQRKNVTFKNVIFRWFNSISYTVLNGSARACVRLYQCTEKGKLNHFIE